MTKRYSIPEIEKLLSEAVEQRTVGREYLSVNALMVAAPTIIRQLLEDRKNLEEKLAYYENGRQIKEVHFDEAERMKLLAERNAYREVAITTQFVLSMELGDGDADYAETNAVKEIDAEARKIAGEET